MPRKPKFTRIPKVEELVRSGVPAEAISTYCALSDYANNKSGLCWPKMSTLAKTLGARYAQCRGTYIYSKIGD